VDELNQDQTTDNRGDLADLVDVDSGPVEQAVEYEAAPQTVEPEASIEAQAARQSEVKSHDSFNALDSALSDIEELEYDGFYDKITEAHIKELPPVARRILHNFRVDRHKQKEQHTSAMQGLLTKIEDRERRLSTSERDFAKRQSEFASLVDDPDVQKLLTEPEGELPDVFTEQGVEARIQRGIAKGMQAVLEPMKAAADVKARENSYLEFVDKHPEMRDPTFKKDVAGLVRNRVENGVPLSTQDAYQLVKARRVMAQQQARATQEQRARQQSARRIGRAVSGGAPSNQEIPSDVKKQGAFAIANWLKANPEAAQRISRSIR